MSTIDPIVWVGDVGTTTIHNLPSGAVSITARDDLGNDQTIVLLVNAPAGELSLGQALGLALDATYTPTALASCALDSNFGLVFDAVTSTVGVSDLALSIGAGFEAGAFGVDVAHFVPRGMRVGLTRLPGQNVSLARLLAAQMSAVVRETLAVAPLADALVRETYAVNGSISARIVTRLPGLYLRHEQVGRRSVEHRPTTHRGH
jgi:hypothetical protein